MPSLLLTPAIFWGREEEPTSPVPAAAHSLCTTLGTWTLSLQVPAAVGGWCYNIWEVSFRGLAALTHFGQKIVLPCFCFVPVLY